MKKICLHLANPRYKLLVTLVFIYVWASGQERTLVQTKVAADVAGRAGVANERRTMVNVSFATSSQRFDRDVPPSINQATVWTASAWKGEKVHAQLLIWGNENIPETSIAVSDLKQASGRSISGKNIITGFVQYVMTDEFANGCGN